MRTRQLELKRQLEIDYLFSNKLNNNKKQIYRFISICAFFLRIIIKK